MRLPTERPRWPKDGTVRVGPNPTALPSPRRPDVRAPNRFDDPDAIFAVRYLADTLRGSLIELLARFRYNDEAEARIRGVEHAEDDDGAHPGPESLTDWFGLQQVVVSFQLSAPAGSLLVSVNDAGLLADLNDHPRVRAALDAAVELGVCERPELDGGTIRLGGPVGRAITQAVSRALYEHRPRPDALAYRSRLDDDEHCWALYGDTKVTFGEPVPLRPDNEEHRRAVQAAAELFNLALPEEWR